MTPEVGYVVDLVGFCSHRISAEAGDVGRQIPALTIIKLIGEGRHVGAFDTLAQGAVERVEAQMIQACRITQIGRWRCQADTRRAVASPRITVAHRTMLGIQRCTTGRVRGYDRCLTDFKGHGQLRTELPGLAGHVRTVLTGRDGTGQRTDALLQPGFLLLGRHRTDQALQGFDRFQLLAVLGIFDHLARLHGLRVIRADVIEQMQRLRRAFHGVGQQIGTAQGKQRKHQPGQKTGRGSHE